MSDISEGLTTPDEREDVNSPDGFERALARATGAEIPEGHKASFGSTDIQDGLEIVEPGKSKQEPVKETPAADLDTSHEEDLPEGDEPSHEDPEIAALLDKHDGDAVKALAEVEERRRNAESVIGRQGSDMGKLREEIAELRGMVKASGERPAPAPALPINTEEVQGQADSLIETHGPVQAALWAVNNRPDGDPLYDAILESWALEDPIQATRFDTRYQMAKAQAAAEANKPKIEPTSDEWVETQKKTQAMGESLDAFSKTAEDWETIAPQMMKALEVVPQRVQVMVASSDPEERLDGIGIVADKARNLARLAAAADTKNKEKGAEKKKAATVTSGSLRPVVQRDSGEEMTSEERQAAFKKALLATETTDVSQGLTYAKS